MSRLIAYVGTYTREGGRGIVVLEFCCTSGRFLRELQQLGAEDPTYLALHPTRDVLFCVNEVRSLGDAATGGVCEFEVDAATDRLTFRRQWPSGGMTPSHLAVDPRGEWLAVANYRGANVALGQLGPSGHLIDLQPRWAFAGSSVHPERQLQAHPHQVVFHDTGVLTPALGADEVVWHALAGSGIATTKLPPGTGPRHLAMAPDGRHCFVLCELSSQLAVLAVGARGEPMELLALHSTRDRSDGPNQTAAIRLHPNGRFLFCSNRGDDTVAVFHLGDGAQVKLIQVVPTGGRWPRDLAITPDGRWLIVANQHAGELAVLPINPDTGELGRCSERWPIIAPACVLLRKSAG